MFSEKMPRKGHCLLLPGRQPGRRFVAGRGVRVGLFEKWKHIRLGLFWVRFPDADEEPQVVTTLDAFTAEVRAEFSIVVGGNGEDREIEQRLYRATKSCPPNRNMDDVIDFDFFRPWAASYCRSAISQTVGNRRYIELFSSTSQANIITEIRARLTEALEGIGLLLIDSTIVIRSREPDSPFVDADAFKQWQQVLQLRRSAELEQLKQENAHELQNLEEKLAHQHQMDAKTAADERRKAEEGEKNRLGIERLKSGSAVASRTLDEQRRQELHTIQERINKIDEASAVALETLEAEALTRQHERAKQAQARADELEDAQRKAEQQRRLLDIEQQRELDLARLTAESEAQQKQLAGHELTVKLTQQRHDLLPLRTALIDAEIEADNKRGAQQAKNEELMVLARVADDLARSELLIKAMPTLANAITAPLGKIGGVQIFHTGGVPGVESQSGLLGSVLAGSTAVPLIQSVMGAVREILAPPAPSAPEPHAATWVEREGARDERPGPSRTAA
jgi:hypothetical protein